MGRSPTPTGVLGCGWGGHCRQSLHWGGGLWQGRGHWRGLAGVTPAVGSACWGEVTAAGGGVSPQGAAAECTYWGSPLKLCSGVGMWGCHPGTLQLGTHGGGHPWGCSGRGSLTMQS